MGNRKVVWGGGAKHPSLPDFDKFYIMLLYT